VRNKKNKWTIAIDLNVYSKNQQFRLFNSVKYGKNNPLIPSGTFPFDCQSQFTTSNILQKSLISFIENDKIPTIYFKDKRFISDLSVSSYSNSNINISNNLINIKLINNHIDNLCFSKTYANVESNQKASHSSYSLQNNNIHLSDQQIQIFKTFVEKIISSDPSYQGYIHSCVPGTQNKAILFFNIGGNYRFCPKKNAHHQNNTVAIIINTKNCTYCIRCKDIDCNNSILTWKTIQ